MREIKASLAGEAAAAASHLKKEEQYWLEKLSGDLVKSLFPYDYRKTSPKDSGDAQPYHRVSFTFSPQLFSRLEQLRNGSDHRLHMILTAGLALLLNKYSYEGNNDIIIGAPVLEQEPGQEYISTVLILRILLDGAINFKELLLTVRETIVDATEHQNYPLAVLLEQL
ncbi:MAG: hypothetical protein GY940_38715 [bacterium]|nr:hypothetical protein [bacterium]